MAPVGADGLPPAIAHLVDLLRPPETVCTPERVGAARLTRHSFAPALVRSAAAGQWRTERSVWELDREGRGEVIYTVWADGRPLRFVVFSDTIPDDARSDRVISTCWDVTAALVDGDLTPKRLAVMRREVPRQEEGRADPRTLVWTRANRSTRFFDYVVERLAAGRQPAWSVLGPSAYILRSTAFYGNGKFGTAVFEALQPPHPLAVPYRAQMLAAWLLREFSYDLAEHCAAARSHDAVTFEGPWRRYLGIGNATGLGMVPFFANHPAIFNAWCVVREAGLAHARTLACRADGPEIARLRTLLGRAIAFCDERRDLNTAPFSLYADVADELRVAAQALDTHGPHERPFDALWRWAEAELGIEAQELLLGLLTDVDDRLDGPLEAALVVDERRDVQPCMPVGEVGRLLAERYRWAEALDVDDPAASHWFWYYAADSEEPRKGRRGVDAGQDREMPVDVVHQLAGLRRDLVDVPDDTPVGAFLLAHPAHRSVVERVQTLGHVPYAEVHDNLLHADFLPLQIQRFKLATYGAENFVPQSTDWVRVTLLQGAPRATDVAAGTADDWIYPPRP